jgi:uncharacterized protein with PQ loop repeat
MWRFNDTFANDLAAAVPGTSSAMFAVQSVTVVSGGVLIKFYIMQNCPKVSIRWASLSNGDNMITSGVDDINLDWSTQTRKLLQSVTTELTSAPTPSNVSATLRYQATDIDSGMHKGVTTSYAEMSSLQVEDDPTSASSSTMLSMTAMIGILAGIVVVIGAAIGCACWYRSKNAKKLNVLHHCSSLVAMLISSSSCFIWLLSFIFVNRTCSIAQQLNSLVV